MSKALFIDDVYLKQYSPVGKSMDVDDIYQFVEQSQDIYIQDILGTPLYNDLVDKLYNGITYSTVEMDLVDLCSKALCYWTCYTALPHIWIKMRNVGVAKQTSDNSQNSDLTELRYIREEMKNLAEFWNTRTVAYLNAPGMINLFPLYNAVSNDMYPSNRQYDSDIYIEDGYKDLTIEELKFLRKYLS